VSDAGYTPVLLKTWPLLTIRHNAIPNPRAAVDVSGWDESWAVWSRVTSAPYPIPGPGTTAFYVEPTQDGCMLENTEGGVALPVGVTAGDWIACQLEVLVGGTVSDEKAVASFTLSWYDDEGNNVSDPTSVSHEGSGYVMPFKNLVNETYWLSAEPRDPADKDFLLPLSGFVRVATNVLVPTGATRFDYFLTISAVNEPELDGANLASLYFTNMQVEVGSEGGTVLPYCDDGTLA
jgi:hypothetical protein